MGVRDVREEVGMWENEIWRDSEENLSANRPGEGRETKP